MSAAIAIDGRKFWWDAPRTQLAIFCNYESALQTEDWLLLEERPDSICEDKSNEVISGISPINFDKIDLNKYIVLGDLEFKSSPLDIVIATVFKPLKFPTVNSNGQNYRVVKKNSQNLLLSVPKEFDYPGVWAVGTSSYPEGLNMKQLDVDLIPVKSVTLMNRRMP
jgi:hypothetical protein